MIIRLRTFGATARQARTFGATARQARTFGAAARQARLRGITLAVLIAGAVMIPGSADVLACPQCFGAEETSMLEGTKLGIAVMLGITFAVQGGFLGFFLYLRNRARRMADVDLDIEWSELQRGSRTS